MYKEDFNDKKCPVLFIINYKKTVSVNFQDSNSIHKNIKKKVCLYYEFNKESEFGESEILFCDGSDYKVINFKKEYSSSKK